MTIAGSGVARKEELNRVLVNGVLVVVALVALALTASGCEAGSGSTGRGVVGHWDTSTSLKCSGGVTYRDPRRDVSENSNGALDLDVPNVDLVSIRIARRPRALCVVFTTAAPLAWGTQFHISYRGFGRRQYGGINYGMQGFDVLLEDRGNVRVSNGETPEDEPRFVDAPVSIDGETLTVLLVRALFERGTPPFSGFAWKGTVIWSADARSVYSDSLPGRASKFFTFPHRRICETLCPPA